MRSIQKLGENCELEMPPAQNPEQESGERVLRRKRGRRRKGTTQSGSHGQDQIFRDLLMKRREGSMNVKYKW